MYVYVKSEDKLWTVGYWGPHSRWHPESDHGSLEDAAARVHYLNGGGRHAEDHPAAGTSRLIPEPNPR